MQKVRFKESGLQRQNILLETGEIDNRVKKGGMIRGDGVSRMLTS